MGKNTLKVVGAAALAYATGGVAGLTAVQTATAAAGAVAYNEADKARQRQEDLMNQAAGEQRQARSVAEAGQAQRAAIEQRQQIREERVRRARILQSASNTGTLASSGAYGATGSLSTNLQTNIGTNLGEIQRGQQISAFQQNAADLGLQSQLAGSEAQNMGSLFQLSTSIFSSKIK